MAGATPRICDGPYLDQGSRMQSQCSQDSSFPSPLSLSLSKFSYSTVPEDSNAPIPWIHLSSKGNLFAIFDKCRSWDHQGQFHEQSRFRIANGAETMEDLNLIALAAEARNAIGHNQVSNILNRPSAVTIIVKKPCVAVRYPAGQGQIRRFQIRFLHDTDYYAAMGRFSEINAPVTEAGTFPTPQPQSHPFSCSSSVLYPSEPVSHLNAQPPSISPVPPLEKCTSISKSSILNGIEPFAGPETSGSLTIQGSALTCTRLQTLPSRVPPKDHLAADTPKSSSILSAPMTSFGQPHINLYEPRPSTAPVIESQGLSEMLPPKRDLPFPKIVQRNGSKASRKAESFTKSGSPKLASEVDNPTLASSLHTSEGPETQSAPPTRNLKRTSAKKTLARVTKKPAAPRPRKRAAGNRETTPEPSVEELLQRSIYSTTDLTTTQNTIDTQRLLDSVKERQALATCQKPVDNHNLGLSFAQEVNTVPQFEPSGALLAEEHLTRKEQLISVSLYEDPAPQSKVLTSGTEIHDSQKGHHSLSQSAPTSGQENPPDFLAATTNPSPVHQALLPQSQGIVEVSCEPSVHSLGHPLTDPLASLLQDPTFAGSPSLAQWAKKPEEERHASLETFICQSIQDEDFYKLCKDLDGTWQRVFLGKM